MMVLYNSLLGLLAYPSESWNHYRYSLLLQIFDTVPDVRNDFEYLISFLTFEAKTLQMDSQNRTKRYHFPENLIFWLQKFDMIQNIRNDS